MPLDFLAPVTRPLPALDVAPAPEAAPNASNPIKGQGFGAQADVLKPKALPVAKDKAPQEKAPQEKAPQEKVPQEKGPLKPEEADAALAWNLSKSALAAEHLPLLRSHFGLSPDQGWDIPLVQALAKFQQSAKLKPIDGKLGMGTLKALREVNEELKRATPLTGLEKTVAASYADWKTKVDKTELGDKGRSKKDIEGLLAPVLALIKERDPVLEQIARGVDLPKEFVAAIWMREDQAMRTTVYLHNGDPLGKKVVNEPKDTPLFQKDQFVEAAIHALKGKQATQTQLNLHYGSNDLAAMATYAERYNGFGYRSHGLVSAYVAAGTSHYKGGMYKSDGKLDKKHWDQRVGVLAVIQAMRNQQSAPNSG